MQYNLINIPQQSFTNYFLQNAYIMQNDGDSLEYNCIPNSTIGLSIIVSGEGFLKVQNEWQKLPRIFIYGLVSKTQIHRLSSGYKVIGLRFNPEFLQLLLKKKISDLPKREAIDLYDLLPKHEATLLYDTLLLASDEKQIIHAINNFLKRNCLKDSIDKKVAYALHKIRNGEIVNVESLSITMNISSTSLRALFNTHVGITPKELLKIYRLRKTLWDGARLEEKLTSLAYLSGYFDQSHFIHEFKDAIGITPLKYFSNNKLTYDFYNFERWRSDSFVPDTKI